MRMRARAHFRHLPRRRAEEVGHDYDYVMTYLGCGLDRVERSERPKFGVLDLPMHADLISSDGIHVVARSS